MQWEEKWAFYQGQTEMVREGQKEEYRGKWRVVLQEVQWEGGKKERNVRSWEKLIRGIGGERQAQVTTYC